MRSAQQMRYIGFNTKKVRLKLQAVRHAGVYRYAGFNTKKVRLKPACDQDYDEGGASSFQYQKGAIKTGRSR